MNTIEPESVVKDSRRTLTQLITDDIKQVNILEGKPNAILGDHYHKETREYFYIVKGSVLVDISKVGSNTHSTRILNPGSAFIVNPYEVHVIRCLTNAVMVVMLTRAYKENSPDIYKDAKV